MELQLEVLARRGDIVESRHRLQLALVDAGGRLLAGTEHPDRWTTFRSGAKPFQLLPLVERGHADRWGFAPEDLAVMAASHTGTAWHVARVRAILERLGLGPEHLACGYHDPDDPESLSGLQRGSVPRSPLYNNCSGKHAGLLALARSEGWPVEGYQLPGHPVQQLLLRTVAEVCGLAPEAVGTAVDGCSVVVFAMSLRDMARGYACLARAMAAPGEDARSRSLGRIGRAMAGHPWAVEGAGRLSTALMDATAGRLVAKCGAEGLQLVGLPERGWGLAVKCDDGAVRATGPAVVAALAHFGELAPAELERLGPVHHPVVRNAAGLEVGSITSELRVVPAA